MTPPPLINISHLGIAIGKDGTSKQLVDDISVSIDGGETVGLVGESGSGKSLTARTLLGLLPRNARITGSVEFNGHSVLNMTRGQLQHHRSHDASMIFQDPRSHINPLRRIGDFLTEGLIATRGDSKSAAYDKAVRLLGDVGVPEPERRMRQRPFELSGGLLQRVMIASGLAMEPRLMLADEPTTALDVTTQEEVMAILAELIAQRGMSMLFITHDLDLAAAVCDRIVVMQSGHVVETLRADQLHTHAQDPYTQSLLSARVALDELAPVTDGENRP